MANLITGHTDGAVDPPLPRTRALEGAAQYGQLEMVRYLVEEYGIDCRMESGQSLIYASMGGHQAVVDYLLAQGAPRPMLRNLYPESPAAA